MIRRRPRPSAAVYDHHGVLIPMDDPHIRGRVREVIERGEYESGDVRAIQAMLEPEDVVLEAGAGLGFMAALCAKRVGGDRVFCYEANPEMEATIRRLWALNDVAPALTMAALSNRAGAATLTRDPEFWTDRLTAPGPGRRAIQTLDVAGELLRRQPTVLLCDCEGSEREILADALHSCVRKVIVELHPEYIGAGACTDLVGGVLAQGFAIRFDLTGGSLWAFERH